MTCKFFEPVYHISYKLACAHGHDLNQSAHPGSFISLILVFCRWILGYPSPSNTLIRLRGWAGWSEPSMGAHAHMYLMLHAGSNFFHKQIRFKALRLCNNPADKC